MCTDSRVHSYVGSLWFLITNSAYKFCQARLYWKLFGMWRLRGKLGVFHHHSLCYHTVLSWGFTSTRRHGITFHSSLTLTSELVILKVYGAQVGIPALYTTELCFGLVFVQKKKVNVTSGMSLVSVGHCSCIIYCTAIIFGCNSASWPSLYLYLSDSCILVCDGSTNLL